MCSIARKQQSAKSFIVILISKNNPLIDSAIIKMIILTWRKNHFPH